MHPPLDRPHPSCEEMVLALKKCHTDNEFAKFWGACNEPKALMDRCFREEKERARSANLAKARAFDRKFEAYLAKSAEIEAKEKK
mgnify:CR=1 FL=1|jgi:COX assembly mitochondrial protein 2